MGFSSSHKACLPAQDFTAIILAGGRGRRLGALTSHRPKSLLRIAGIPLIERLIRLLAAAGVTDICVVVGYLAETLEAELQDGRQLGVALRYIWQDGGPEKALAAAIEHVGNPLMLCLCADDLFSENDLATLMALHTATGKIVTRPVTRSPLQRVKLVSDPSRIAEVTNNASDPIITYNMALPVSVLKDWIDGREREDSPLVEDLARLLTTHTILAMDGSSIVGINTVADIHRANALTQQELSLVRSPE